MYLEQVFELNLAVNLLVLYLAGRLIGERARLWRYVLSAGLGGLYAAATLLPPCVVLTTLPAKAMLSAVLALIAWRPRGLRGYCKGWASLVGVTALGGGAALAAGLLLAETSPTGEAALGQNALLLTVLGAAAMVVFSTGAIRRRGGAGPRCDVRVWLDGHPWRLWAFVDTGNLLREPLSGLPVVIADPRLARRLLAGHATVALSFGTVGGQSSLPAVLADRVEVRRAGRWQNGGAMYVAQGGMPLQCGADALLPGAALE